ncbi:MAG: hypothetical protein AAF959_20780 [Cyanobacteria bacterium P01_D01_bin.56]
MTKGPLLVSLVVLSAIAGGSFAYGWNSVIQRSSSSVTHQQETQEILDTPSDQHTTAENPVENASKAVDLTTTAPSIAQQLSTSVSDNGAITLTLDETQLNQLINKAILSQEQAAQLLANAHSLRTEVSRDRIETGAVMNLADIPLEGLPTELQQGLTQLTNAAPMLTNRDIYVGLIAKPKIQDGQISLEQDLSLQFGQFTLSLADVASRMGVSMQDVEQEINTVLAQRGITLNHLEIVDDQIVITGSQL